MWWRVLPLPTPQCLVDESAHQGELGDALLLGQLLLQTEVKASRSVLVAGPWLWAIAILEGSDFVGELQGNKRI